MGVVSLIIGILGFVVFCWLGPTVGGIWAGAATAGAFAKGDPTVVTWPIWAMGLVVGVLFPLVGAVLGIVAIKRSEAKGLGIAGVVTGLVSAVIGLGVTLFLAFAGDVGDHYLEENLKNMDPAAQQQLQPGLQQLIDQANKQSDD